MAGNNNLFGTLQTPLKPIHYTGIDTETIDVIVDSENRTIRANIQPDVMEVIGGNVSALKAAYEKLTELSKEIDKVEQVITGIYNNLTGNINQLKNDTTVLSEDILRIQNEYATQAEVRTWIDEARIPQAELNTYAKKVDVDEQIDRINAELSTLLSTEAFEVFADETVENFVELNDSLDAVNTRIDTFEASIGPLPSDKTLKEEIFNTFATRDALEEVQNTAGTNSVLIRDIESELFDINEALENTASKDYVAEEISKIDLSDINLDNYYTKDQTYNRTEIDSKIASSGGGSAPDLSNYYTQAETLSEITKAINSIDTITATLD